MPAHFQTYGLNHNGRTRQIVAARSKKHAASLFGVSVDVLNKCGATTMNDEEVKLAMEEKGVVWSRLYHPYAPFARRANKTPQEKL